MEIHLRTTGVTCQLPYGITQYYLPPDTSEHPAGVMHIIIRAHRLHVVFVRQIYMMFYGVSQSHFYSYQSIMLG